MWVGLLGPLLVRGGAGQIEVPAAKQRAVLAALALRAGQVVSFDALAEAVWDDAPPPGARVTVRNYVLRLRQLLGPAGGRIVTRDPGYVLDTGAADVDVLAFGRMYRDGGAAVRAGAWAAAAEVLREALALWRGAPLADVPAPVLYREWADRLEQERLHAVEWRIGAQLHLGAHGEVLGELERLVAEHPLREQVHGLLMLALYRVGRPGDALAAYQHARRLLVDELGVEPGDELRRLQQQVLARDPALTAPVPAVVPGQPRAPVVPRQLPAAVAHFAGRAGELKLLAGQLDNPGAGETVVISAIGGTAGVGKTALAVHFAHQMSGRFPDGQLYANLRGFGPSGPPLAPVQAIRGFLDALRVPPEAIPADVDAQAGLYRSLTAGKRMLVLLDNARDAAQVRPLLPGSAGCLVVVTSRNQLTGLAAGHGARLLTLGLLTDTEAGELLAGRLGAERAAAEPEAAAELVRLCAGLPLAVAIAAARAAARPAHPLAALAAELRGADSRLDALDTGEPAGSVRAVFSWSYQQLSPAAARLFRLFGIHPGPDISAPGAASLTGAGLPGARQLLAELARAHLVTEHAPGRYTCHDLLRAYAAELTGDLDSDAERRAATHRTLDHYLHTAHAAVLLLNPISMPLALDPPQAGAAPERLTGHQQALAWFDAEHHVLLAAVALAAGTGFDRHAWQLPWAMADFLDRRGHWHDWAAVQRTALDAATRLGDTAGEGTARRLLASACASLADYDQARDHLKACLGLYRQLGDRAEEARVHQTLSWVFDRQARYADALGHAEHAQSLYEDIGDQAGRAAALNIIGWCHALLGDYPRARAICQRALDLNRELGDRHGEAHSWDSIGYAEHHLGRPAEATAHYQRALGLFSELGDSFDQAEVLTHLGDTHHASGEIEAARTRWRAAMVILDGLHHPDAAKLRAKLGAGGHDERAYAAPIQPAGSSPR
jgi:DNA-binding SARP family transcriptional activator/tetratricopeptide (TPR) repeat protein